MHTQALESIHDAQHLEHFGICANDAAESLRRRGGSGAGEDGADNDSGGGGGGWGWFRSWWWSDMFSSDPLLFSSNSQPILPWAQAEADLVITIQDVSWH